MALRRSSQLGQDGLPQRVVGPLEQSLLQFVQNHLADLRRRGEEVGEDELENFSGALAVLARDSLRCLETFQHSKAELQKLRDAISASRVERRVFGALTAFLEELLGVVVLTYCAILVSLCVSTSGKEAVCQRPNPNV